MGRAEFIKKSAVWKWKRGTEQKEKAGEETERPKRANVAHRWREKKNCNGERNKGTKWARVRGIAREVRELRRKRRRRRGMEGGLSVTLSCLSLWLRIGNPCGGRPLLLVLSGLGLHFWWDNTPTRGAARVWNRERAAGRLPTCIVPAWPPPSPCVLPGQDTLAHVRNERWLDTLTLLVYWSWNNDSRPVASFFIHPRFHP